MTRIQELAEQARNYALDEKRIYERVHNTEQCMEEYREVYNKKFAQLIVKECMTVCADNACRAGGTNTQVGEDLYLAVDLIKEHFGVEE